MNEERLCTIEQIERFLSASAPIEFSASGDDSERYAHIARVLQRFDCPRRGKRERGVLLWYLQHTSGCSRAQVTRLETQWHGNRPAEVPLVKRYGAPAKPFARKYTAADIALLVEMDKAHEDVCGPAIAHLLQRAGSTPIRAMSVRPCDRLTKPSSRCWPERDATKSSRLTAKTPKPPRR